MSRQQEALAREIKQLWCIAGVYLCRARTLETEKRKHEEIWRAFEKGRGKAEDLQALKGSADLTSAAIRLASLEERLLGNQRRLWKAAYAGQSRSYVHVYLRDAAAHAEPTVADNARWTRRQRWLGALRLKDALRYVRDVQIRLGREIRAPSVHRSNMDSWLTGDAPRWISSMLNAGNGSLQKGVNAPRT